jgi:hypothetical protein
LAAIDPELVRVTRPVWSALQTIELNEALVSKTATTLTKACKVTNPALGFARFVIILFSCGVAVFPVTSPPISE